MTIRVPIATCVLTVAAVANPPTWAAPVSLQAATQVGRPIYHSMQFKFDSGQTYSQDATGGSSSSSPNPWLHRRLTVHFTHSSSGATVSVPGFFAGDGSGGGTGRIWKARFAPELVGDWTYEGVFEAGDQINVQSAGTPGTIVPLSGASLGVFTAKARSVNAPGFLKDGFLRQAANGPNYLTFSEPTADPFVQVGVGSPENFLGYDGFTGLTDGNSANGSICQCDGRGTGGAAFSDCYRDEANDSPNNTNAFLHQYPNHVND